MRQSPVLIAGGGIGGLAAALACSRAGLLVQLFEQAPEFGEIGAGIQLGPNVMRVLQGWGLDAALAGAAAFPARLRAREALSGDVLGVLPLGRDIAQRYGAPYAAIHRADMHGLLLQAVRDRGDAVLHLQRVVSSFEQAVDGVTLRLGDGASVQGDVLIGADGLWSRVRAALLADGPPRVSGHLAYRAMVPQHSLPESLRSSDVTVWLGPDMHVVQYPVRQGDWLNVVAIVHGQRADADLSQWDHLANASDLRTALADTCAPLRDLVEAIDYWRLWVLCDREPMRGAHEQAHGRVALLGDAAHPMRPYLAQGAGMAIEDAAELGRCLTETGRDFSAALRRYAERRWQRNARVQARSIRNGAIFHAQGPLRWGRDLSLRLLGAKLLDQPWLYGY